MTPPEQVADGGSGAAENPNRDKYIMYLKSVQGSAIRSLFETMKEIVHDVSLEFDNTGIKIQTLDGARCAYIYLKLNGDSFEEYHCPGKWQVGVNMASMFKLLRMAGSHDTVIMYATHEASNELGIQIQNAEKNSNTVFSLKLLDVDSEEISIPDVEYDAIITLPSAYFQRICRDMLNLSNSMTIRSEGGVLTLSCSGDFASQSTQIGEAHEGMAISGNSGKVVQGVFSLKYLVLFCRASNMCNTIELYLRESFPLIMRFNVASLGEIRFCLAPNVGE